MIRLYSSRSSIYCSLLCLCLLIPNVFANSNDLYPFSDPKQQQLFTELLKELRCLVCQNQDLSDSHAPVAKDLRTEVYYMVRQGKSKQEITGYLTERYGDFILFVPPVNQSTYLLWFGPFLLLGVSMVWLVYFIVVRNRRLVRSPS